MAPIISVSDEDYEALKQLGVRHKLVETPGKAELVVPASDFWTIPNVHYRGESLTADLSNRLLPVRTQQQHAEHRNSAQEEEFVTADMPFYFAVFGALFEQKDALEYAEQARDFIKNAIRQNFPITLTRIAYSPIGEDVVTHNYGTKGSYEVKANIVGPDRFIERGDKGALTAIVGNGDVSRINKVFNWINGTNTYIWRLNEKSEESIEKVAGFDAGSDSARVDCGRPPANANASLGVRVNARSAKFSKE